MNIVEIASTGDTGTVQTLLWLQATVYDLKNHYVSADDVNAATLKVLKQVQDLVVEAWQLSTDQMVRSYNIWRFHV